MLILLSSAVLARPALASLPKDQYELRCLAELTNGDGFKHLPASVISKNLDSGLEVAIPVGQYTLKGAVKIMGKNNFNARPHLVMDLFKGDPIKNNLFHATTTGFTKSLKQEIAELSGYQFLDYEHDKVKYTRIDYSCEVRWSKRK